MWPKPHLIKRGGVWVLEYLGRPRAPYVLNQQEVCLARVALRKLRDRLNDA